ncbi:MAG: type I R/M system specificity subunit [Balneolaceae bacterium]|nr:type I R/M system specificity subunit [Balneolaceae bacterium]
MSSELVEVNVEDFINVTDYVANGSFSSLKENVNYIENDGYAILIRLVDYNNGWGGDFRFVDKTSYEFLGKSSVVPGDVVISNVGANAGTVFKVPDLGKPMTLGPNSVLLKPRVDLQEVKDYLYYFFSSPVGQHLLNSITAGSAQPKFNKTDLRSRNIPIPADGNYEKIISPLLSLLCSSH